MQIQINAAARLNQSQQVRAATADDASKVVLWIQKALPGVKGKKKGRAGKQEGMEFKTALKGENALTLYVLLDHTYEPPQLHLMAEGPQVSWSAEEKTGRKTIVTFKDQMKQTLANIKGEEGMAPLEGVIKSLLKAKSKIETE